MTDQMDWQSILGDADTWTVTQVEQRMRWVAGRLRDAITERTQVGEQYGAAMADYENEYHRQHLLSAVDEKKRADKWNVAMHESHAKNETADLNVTRLALKEQKSALVSEISALQSILDILRSSAKTSRELGGGNHN